MIKITAKPSTTHIKGKQKCKACKKLFDSEKFALYCPACYVRPADAPADNWIRHSQECDSRQGKDCNCDFDPEGRRAFLAKYYRLTWDVATALKNNALARMLGELDDIAQACAIAMHKALDNYRPETGVKWITYASNAIYRNVTREAAAQGGMIRIPQNIIHDVMKDTDPEEKKGELARRYLEHAKAASVVRPFIQDEHGSTVEPPAKKERQGLDRETIDELTVLMSFLKPRHREIIRQRFGIGCRRMNLQEIADEMGLTRERIRQIEGQALRQIRRRALEFSLLDNCGAGYERQRLLDQDRSFEGYSRRKAKKVQQSKRFALRALCERRRTG